MTFSRTAPFSSWLLAGAATPASWTSLPGCGAKRPCRSSGLQRGCRSARPKGPSPCSLIWLRAKTKAKPQAPSNHAPSSNSNLPFDPFPGRRTIRPNRIRPQIPDTRNTDRAQRMRLARADHLDERSRDRRDKVCYLATGQAMKYDLFIRVALAEDLPERHLRRGDVATVVEHHPGRPGQEAGYTLEVFNAVGETVDVGAVRESQIEGLTAAELLSVRPMAASTR